MSTGCPYVWTTTMPRVRGVSSRSTWLTSTFQVSRSASTSTGTAPV